MSRRNNALRFDNAPPNNLMDVKRKQVISNGFKEELLDTVAKGNFKAIRLRAVSGEVFVMLLECDDGVFVHEHNNGNTKEYPNVDNTLREDLRSNQIKYFGFY